jgi:hypothetical protein
MKINTGTNEHEVAGWDRDDSYVTGGEDFTFGQAADASGVTNAAPVDVYRTCRHWDHSYSFQVIPNGTYTVRLHLYDQFGGDRKMDYTIEGTQVLDDFAPAVGVAIVKDFTVDVTDGNGLQIAAAAQDAGGDVFECGIEIIAGGGPVPTEVTIDAFTASPATIAPGGSSTLTWQTSNATSVKLDGNTVLADGSQMVSPAATTTYTLTAEGEGSPKTRSVTVTVASDPVLTTITVTPSSASVQAGGTQSFTASPKDQFGQPITAAVTWTVSGAGTVSPTSGLTTTFTAGAAAGTPTVTASSGSVTRTATVTVTAAPVTDSDSDGMDDDWERTYFGDLSHDGSADTDGDGDTDYQEYIARTNPTVDEGAGGSAFGCGSAEAGGAALASFALAALALVALRVLAGGGRTLPRWGPRQP